LLKNSFERIRCVRQDWRALGISGFMLACLALCRHAVWIVGGSLAATVFRVARAIYCFALLRRCRASCRASCSATCGASCWASCRRGALRAGARAPAGPRLRESRCCRGEYKSNAEDQCRDPFHLASLRVRVFQISGNVIGLPVFLPRPDSFPTLVPREIRASLHMPGLQIRLFLGQPSERRCC
jgi:hypothetical protein